MAAPNPFDDYLDATVQAMVDESAHLARMAAGVRPYNSKPLPPAEETFIYQNPHAYYPDVKDPTTGLPLTNAQAAQMMLKQWGPDQYIQFVERNEKRLSQTPVQPEGGAPDDAAVPAGNSMDSDAGLDGLTA